MCVKNSLFRKIPEIFLFCFSSLCQREPQGQPALCIGGTVLVGNIRRIDDLVKIEPDVEPLVVDLQEVHFLGSAGIARFLQIHDSVSSAGGRFRIVHLNPKLEGLFKATRLDKLFPVV